MSMERTLVSAAEFNCFDFQVTLRDQSRFQVNNQNNRASEVTWFDW